MLRSVYELMFVILPLLTHHLEKNSWDTEARVFVSNAHMSQVLFRVDLTWCMQPSSPQRVSPSEGHSCLSAGSNVRAPKVRSS